MNAVFAGIDVLLSVRITLPSIINLFDINPYQTATGVGASYDALGDLFECVANLLRRLHTYTEKIPPFPEISDIMVKIMIEVVNVVALATEQIKNGRFSEPSTTHHSSLAHRSTEKFAKRLLGESDVEAILRRLDRLTQEEAQMTGVHTLEVVHGMFDNLKLVMNGEIPYSGCHKTTEKTQLSRREGIIRCHTTNSGYF